MNNVGVTVDVSVTVGVDVGRVASVDVDVIVGVAIGMGDANDRQPLARMYSKKIIVICICLVLRFIAPGL